MNKRWTSIAWAIAAIVLLLSIGYPIQVLTMSFLAIPFVMLFTTLSTRSFVIHLVGVMLVTFILGGSLGSTIVLLSLYFLIPGIVMGVMYKRKKAGWHVLSAGAITFLAESLLLLAIGTLLFKFNLNMFITDQINMSMGTLKEAAGVATDRADEFAEMMIHTITSMIPVMLIISSLFMGTITYAISRRLLTASGVEVRKMKPIKSWMLPRSLIVYYIITLILQLVAGNSTDSFLSIIVINLTPLVQLALVIQGIAFMFFFADHKGWPKVIPILLTIAALFIPIIYLVLRYIGLADLLLPLRKLVTKPKQ